MTALCEQCGSIRIVRAQSTPADRLVAILTWKRPFVCRRCGWRGRRYWTDKDLRKLLDYGAGGAETDPALSVLDAEPSFPGRQKRHSDRLKGDSIGEPVSQHVDIGALSTINDDQGAVVRRSGVHAPPPRHRR